MGFQQRPGEHKGKQIRALIYAKNFFLRIFPCNCITLVIHLNKLKKIFCKRSTKKGNFMLNRAWCQTSGVFSKNRGKFLYNLGMERRDISAYFVKCYNPRLVLIGYLC